MEEVFKQYGAAILISIAFGLIVLVLFQWWQIDTDGDGVVDRSGSILEGIGQMVAPSTSTRKDYNADADKQEFDAYASRKQPTAVTKRSVKEHTSMCLLDCFDITDDDGYQFDSVSYHFDGQTYTGQFKNGSGEVQNGVVKILSIKDSAGREYIDDTSVYNKTTGEVMFPHADTYAVQLDIFDCYTVETNCTCYVAADLLL